MQNFNWLDKEGTKGGNEGGGYVRAVCVCLTSNLPNIVPSIRKLVCEELDSILPLKKLENARKETVIQAAKQYIEQVFLGAELIRLLPRWMAPILTDVHDQAITIALQDLCLHPEYLEPLRQDIDNHYLDFKHTAQGLSLLDSFIKESARLTPTEAYGTHLNRGDWACTPQIAINKIPEYYPNPEQFSGFRFAPPEVLESL
ncbi:hypothetical protein QC764_0039320 [Podospora pseudoanserina]|uniref:Uncharacterized protein n=1 Tax=Podospora pseudoanserina TaxID=2609844 RepID=A0ABR0IHP4_9PEZI|nr:hypothetical protein QC764_0039320 [Podospora pseudoanserina]